MKKDRDKFLSSLLNVPYHFSDGSYMCQCPECARENVPLNHVCDENIKFYTYDGLGKLITWLKDKPLWAKIRWNIPMADFMELMTNPDKAADRLYEYLKEGANAKV